MQSIECVHTRAPQSDSYNLPTSAAVSASSTLFFVYIPYVVVRKYLENQIS